MTSTPRRTPLLLTLGLAIACHADIATAPDDTALAPRDASRDVSAAAEAPIKIITQQLPDGQIGQPYDLFGSVGIVASAKNRPLTWKLTAGTLPAGLTLDPTTGNITGTPTTKGCAQGLVFTATDAKGNTADTRQLSLCIDDPHFGVYVTGTGFKNTPTEKDKTNDKHDATLVVKYFVNGQAVQKTVKFTIPANATAGDVLTAIEPAITAALGNDFDVTLTLGAANPRIEIVGKPGTTLGTNAPNLGGQPPKQVYTIQAGKLKITVALANGR